MNFLKLCQCHFLNFFSVKMELLITVWITDGQRTLPLGPRAQKSSRFNVCMVCGNLDNCKHVCEYALENVTINWNQNDQVLHNNLMSLTCWKLFKVTGICVPIKWWRCNLSHYNRGFGAIRRVQEMSIRSTSQLSVHTHTALRGRNCTK